MAIQARTTFQKKQKEMERKDRQMRKAERREQRRLHRSDTLRVPQDSVLTSDEDPVGGRARILSSTRPSS